MTRIDVLLIMILVSSNLWMFMILISLHKKHSNSDDFKNGSKAFLEKHDTEKTDITIKAEDNSRIVKEWLSVREFSNIIGKTQNWVYYRYKKPGLMEYVAITDDGRVLINKAAISRVA